MPARDDSWKRQEQPAEGASVVQVRIAKDVLRKQVALRLSKIVFYVLAVAVAIYLCFAATILRVLPSLDMGPVPVKNMTFAGGHAPAGAQLVASLGEAQGDGVVDHLKQAFTFTDGIVQGEVLAGPFGQISVPDDHSVVVDGKNFPMRLQQAHKGEYLSNEYLLKCLGGPCVKGEVIVVPAKNVYGEPLGKMSTSGGK